MGSADLLKDVAIFYPEDLAEFANNLDISLEEYGIENFPTHESGTLVKAAKGSKFRLFLINSQFQTKKMEEHRQILIEHCTKKNTLIVLDRKASLKLHPKLEEFSYKIVYGLTDVNKIRLNAKKVVKLIDDFMNPPEETSDDTGHSSYLEDTTSEFGNSSLNQSGTASPASTTHDPSLRSRAKVPQITDSPDKKQQKEESEQWVNHEIKHKQSSRAPQLIWGVIMLFVMICVGYLVDENARDDRELSTVEKFVDRIEVLQSQFDQDPRFWRTVRSTMKRHIIDEDPTQPTILMLVSTKHAADSREKLAREIAQAYSARCNDMDPIWLSGNDYVARDHAEVKERIDDKISTGFLASACATVISNFEKLPPASTTTFYQFCENDQAPFKKVAVIFTVEISHGSWDSENQHKFLQEGETPPPKFWDQITEAYLYHSLQSRDRTGIMKNEMIGGLMSRITPSVVWVKK